MTLRTKSFAFLLLTIAPLLSRCARGPATAFTDRERRNTAIHFNRVIESVGGSRVWIKVRAPEALPAKRPGTPVEVLVVRAALDSVLSAIRREATNQGFQVKSKSAPAPAPHRAIDLAVLRGREEVCRWRFREVPRLSRAAIVIDDLGGDLDIARRITEWPYAVTVSILPHLRHSAEVAERTYQAGREVMLHLPMEPEASSSIGPGEWAIKIGMSRHDVAVALRDDLASVPHALGVNNHMGSRATTDAELMSGVMRILAGRHLYFIDSRTSAASVALEMARKYGVPAFYRSVFLDDTESVRYTLAQLQRFRRVVEEQGVGLAIGHPYPTTIAALARSLPELEKDDIKLVPVSELVRLPEAAQLSPPVPEMPGGHGRSERSVGKLD